jgi:hypothetical protein
MTMLCVSFYPLHFSLLGSTALQLSLGLSFNFLILYTVFRTPLTGDQPVARPLPTHMTTQTQNKRTQTSRPAVGFEPTIPVLERTKTANALKRAAVVMGYPLHFLHTIWLPPPTASTSHRGGDTTPLHPPPTNKPL